MPYISGTGPKNHFFRNKEFLDREALVRENTNETSKEFAVSLKISQENIRKQVALTEKRMFLKELHAMKRHHRSENNDE